MEKLTIKHLKEIKEYSYLANYEEYNSNFVTMMMWNHHYEILCEIHENYVLLLCKYSTCYAWLMPLCEEKYLKEAFIQMEKYSNEQGFRFEIHGMNQQLKDYCEKNELYFIYEQDIDAQDYVYDIEMQRSLSGKKMQKRRNHYNAFLKEHEQDYTYRALRKEDRNLVFDFINEWKKTHHDEKSIDIEKKGIETLFDYFDELNLHGGCIFIHDELKGFHIYSELSERMIQMHVEKVDKSIRGCSIALLKNTLSECDEKYQLLNREDDMGLDYLRKAKKDMNPVFKVKKYTAIQGKPFITKAIEKDLEAIQTLWVNSFYDEDEFTTNFYFNHLYIPENTYLLKYENTLLSMLQVRYMDIYKDGIVLKAPLIFGVATPQKYQGCGYMKQLMNAVLNELATPFILIQAYNWDLYRSFGFSEAYEIYQSTFKSQGEYDGDICNDTNHLLDLYHDFVSDKDGYRIRDCKYYDEFLIPYLKPYSEIYANEDAYIIVDKDHTLVSECIYRNEKALISLLNRFESIQVNCNLTFEKPTLIHVLMAKGKFNRNDALFISDVM